jgi:hypothetical protein
MFDLPIRADRSMLDGVLNTLAESRPVETRPEDTTLAAQTASVDPTKWHPNLIDITIKRPQPGSKKHA